MLKSSLKAGLRRALPLALRKKLAIAIHQSRWLPERQRQWWSQQVVSDFASVDASEYHKFLWANHMAYARTYDVEHRFGDGKLNKTREMLLEDLGLLLEKQGLVPERDVLSVFDVGCSLGYLLRHLETGLFAGAKRLTGIDIDAQAIRDGDHHLKALGSKVALQTADMESLPGLLGAESYDVFLCTGVLMYLTQPKAQQVVKTILAHTKVVACFAGLADPGVDNAKTQASSLRAEDGSFIHNIDKMVELAGGRVVFRRWEGARLVDGNTVYFVFAAP